MEKALVDYIIGQRKEAEEFSKKPGCWMGMVPCHTDTAYWSERVPSGTLKEYDRITLEEGAYYAVADAFSKSLARSMDFSSMTDEELHAEIDSAVAYMNAEAEEEAMREEAEQKHFDELASSLNVDRETFNRWMATA